jgi:predicted RNA-binding protein with PIN domain
MIRMTFLIDGHNLINAIPDIDLDDPHDEAKLVEKLKAYCARVRKKAIVVFDHGLPGGQSHDLSTGQIKVIFAAAHRTNADRVIRERVRNARDPGQYTVVSSDHEVQNAAYQRRMTVLTSELFVDKMSEAMAQAVEDERSKDVKLSASEVDEWLRLFGIDEDSESDPA